MGQFSWTKQLLMMPCCCCDALERKHLTTNIVADVHNRRWVWWVNPHALLMCVQAKIYKNISYTYTYRLAYKCGERPQHSRHIRMCGRNDIPDKIQWTLVLYRLLTATAHCSTLWFLSSCRAIGTCILDRTDRTQWYDTKYRLTVTY